MIILNMDIGMIKNKFNMDVLKYIGYLLRILVLIKLMKMFNIINI